MVQLKNGDEVTMDSDIHRSIAKGTKGTVVKVDGWRVTVCFGRKEVTVNSKLLK